MITYWWGSEFILEKGLTPQGAEGWGKIGSKCAKSSNDFSETTGQILMKLGHNDHVLVGIRIYT